MGAASTAAFSGAKNVVIAGMVVTLACGAAFAKSTFSSVAPKAGEGAGIGAGSIPQFLQGATKGLQEMTGPQANTPPVAAPPALAGQTALR